MTRMTTVQGVQYKVWGDHDKRGTMAMNMESGEAKQISYSGYVSNDLSVRKAIANTFKIASFRK